MKSDVMKYKKARGCAARLPENSNLKTKAI